MKKGRLRVKTDAPSRHKPDQRFSDGLKERNTRRRKVQQEKAGALPAPASQVALIAPRSNFLEFALDGLFRVGRAFGRAFLLARAVAFLWACAVAWAAGRAGLVGGRADTLE